MRRIYLLRHGEPDFPGGIKVCMGKAQDYPLSEQGRKEALELRKYFLGKDSTDIFCSDARRSIQTAAYIRYGSERIQVVKGLGEIDPGRWAGNSFDKIRKSEPEYYKKRGEDLINIPFPGGESMGDVRQRVHSVFRQVLKMSRGDLILCGHSTVNRVILHFALDIDLAQTLEIPQPYGCISVLEEEEGKFSASVLGAEAWKLNCQKAAERIYQKYQVSSNIRRHCEKVAQVADEIACLLVKKGYQIDREIVYRSALFHDIARRYPQHPKVASQWLEIEGFTLEAEIVLEHHELKNTAKISEKEIVFLADKYVQEAKKVNLEKRFQDSLKKCRTQSALQKHQEYYEQAVQIERMLYTAPTIY